MALGSLIDAGVDIADIREVLSRLGIGGWSIEAEPVLRSGIAATYLRIEAEDDSVVRTFPAVRAILENADLPMMVRERSIAAFSALATVESRLHRRDPNQVHFHELSGHDTLIDIVGTMAALELLEIDDVYASPIATGTGIVRTLHGHISNPAPAVLELLVGAPLWGRDVNVELTTPTGAAILSTLAKGFGPMPAMVIDATGYGAGTKEIDGLPNCTQVVVGTRTERSTRASRQDPRAGQPLVLIEANVDDVTGEQLSDVLQALIDAGAADAWITPVLMKKGRPGHVVSMLCDLALEDALRQVLIDESGTFGVRAHVVDRFATTRRTESIDVEGHEVHIKVSPGRAKVEHDDAARVARKIGLPVREVLSRAELAWRSHPSAARDEDDGEPS
jgi:uncharacterized protein (TIGR00299 family) protein